MVTPGCTMALIMQFYGSLGEMFACCPALRDLQQLIVCVDDAARWESAAPVLPSCRL